MVDKDTQKVIEVIKRWQLAIGYIITDEEAESIVTKIVAELESDFINGTSLEGIVPKGII